MPRIAPAPQPVESMTGRQLARRQALLRAVMDLARESGIDNVQMKAVAERSQVALGTTYRYFASKEHLLASALQEWYTRYADRVLEEAAGVEPGSWEERVDAVVAFLQRGITGFARYPSYADLLVFVTASRDPHAVAALNRMSEYDMVVLRTLLGEPYTEEFDAFTFVMAAIWLHVIVTWRSNRITLEQAYRDCENGIRMACAGLLVAAAAVPQGDRVA
jgi:TetR/AcrR family transcriptional regulator, cholesterol catabolism regulator